MRFGSATARWIVVLVFACSAMPVRAATESSISASAGDRVFVLSLKASGALAEVANDLSEIAVRSIRATVPTSTVFAQTELDSMLAFEKQKDLLGCESNVSCLAEIGGALGADALVLGSLGKVGSVFILSMKLVDTNRAVVLRHLSEEVVEDEDALLEAIKQMSSALFAADKPMGHGYLDVLGEGVVFVDDRNVGNAPLRRLAVEPGTHIVELKRGTEGEAVLRKQVLVNRFATVHIEPEKPHGNAASSPASTEERAEDKPTTRNGWFMQGKVGMSVIVQNSVDSQKRSITGPTLVDAQTLGGYAWQSGFYLFGALSVTQLSRLLGRDDSQNTFEGEYDDVTVPPYLFGVGGGVGYGSSGRLRLGVSLSVQRSFLLTDVYGLTEISEEEIGTDRTKARELLGSRGDGYWNIRPAVDIGIAATEHLYLGLSVSAPMFVGDGNTLSNIGVAAVAGFAAPPALAEGESSFLTSWKFWTATGLVALVTAAVAWQAVAAP